MNEKSNLYGSWKEKAKERRLENKKLKSRIMELTGGRDTWKEKASLRLEKISELEKENRGLKNTVKKN